MTDQNPTPAETALSKYAGMTGDDLRMALLDGLRRDQPVPIPERDQGDGAMISGPPSMVEEGTGRVLAVDPGESAQFLLDQALNVGVDAVRNGEVRVLGTVVEALAERAKEAGEFKVRTALSGRIEPTLEDVAIWSAEAIADDLIGQNRYFAVPGMSFPEMMRWKMMAKKARLDDRLDDPYLLFEEFLAHAVEFQVDVVMTHLLRMGKGRAKGDPRPLSEFLKHVRATKDGGDRRGYESLSITVNLGTDPDNGMPERAVIVDTQIVGEGDEDEDGAE